MAGRLTYRLYALLLALGLLLPVFWPQPAQAGISLSVYQRLIQDEDGEAALRWYFAGLRDALQMYQDYEQAARQIGGFADARAQNLYCMDDGIILSTELLRSFVELAIERTPPESHEQLSVTNAIIEELTQIFPCD